MTTMTTPGDFRSPQNGRVPHLDSPAVRTRARGRVPVTHSAHNIRDQALVHARTWWGFTARPATLTELWAASGVDTKRIPGNNPALRAAWLMSNWTDRLIMFALIALLPTLLTGALRWCAQRPTRRYGLYLTAAVLTAAHLILGRN